MNKGLGTHTYVAFGVTKTEDRAITNTNNIDPNIKKFERIGEANLVFTPGYPVHQQSLFSGRSAQLQRVVESITQPGRHPVIFGQRGVGKTSLANILAQAFRGLLSVKISCDGSDTFATIWNRVMHTASVEFKEHALGFSASDSVQTISLGDALGHDPRITKPAEISDLLRNVDRPCVIILDEFDKVSDKETKSAFSDLIKIISDSAPLVTLIIVGVAENIHDLIGEHPSIDRNLIHIEVPVMSDDEIRAIYIGGLHKLKITGGELVANLAAHFTGGFPHYAHLLGLSSVKACAENNTYDLTPDLFDVACNMALEDAVEKYRDDYAKATATTQASRYQSILSACGYAHTDIRGVFRATDVTDAIYEVFGEKLTVQAVVPALSQFLQNQRASVLKAIKVGGRQCYQFRDPMMRPFCRLKAHELIGARR